MACTSYTLSGINDICKQASFGGIKDVYIALYDDISGVTLDENQEQIDEITLTTNGKFYAYHLLKSTGGLTSTLNVSETTTSYFTNEVTLQFMKMETSKRMKMMALFMSACVVIVKDYNNQYWYLGKDTYVEASAGTATTGTATSDSNHYEITLTDTSAELPYAVSETAIGTLKQNGKIVEPED